MRLPWVSYSQRNWHNIKENDSIKVSFLSTNTSENSKISSEDAINIFVDYLKNKSDSIPNENEITSIELVYSYATSENENTFELVWEIMCDSGIKAHININNGNVSCDYFD